MGTEAQYIHIAGKTDSKESFTHDTFCSQCLQKLLIKSTVAVNIYIQSDFTITLPYIKPTSYTLIILCYIYGTTKVGSVVQLVTFFSFRSKCTQYKIFFSKHNNLSYFFLCHTECIISTSKKISCYIYSLQPGCNMNYHNIAALLNRRKTYN